jgi:hypothetical protein
VAESALQPDRRAQPRYAVEAAATLRIVNGGGAIPAHVSEISLGGCRIHFDAHYRISQLSTVEIEFKLRGMAFRLAGVTQWTDRRAMAGVRFHEMTWRRKEEVMEVLAELEAEAKAKAAKEAAAKASAHPPELVEQGLGTQAFVRIPGGRERSVGPPEQIRLLNPAAEPQPVRRPGRERRVQSRHSVDSRAAISFIDVRAQSSGRLLDVSMSGCRIRTDERFPSGIYRRVEVEFTLDGLPFRLGGVVQSLHDRYTVGIRLLNLSDRKREQLAMLMEELEEARRRDDEQNQDNPPSEEPQAGAP